MDELEKTMRRYLLGELSESEQSALEEKYFTDPQIFNQLLETESELLDGYARAQLSKEICERIEQSYMDHPARADRVKFAATLTTRLDQIREVNSREQTTPRVSWWQSLLASVRGQRPALTFSIALITLLIVVGGIWFFAENQRRQRQEAYEAQQQLDRERLQQAADEVRRAKELTAKEGNVGGNPPEIPTSSPTPKLNSAVRSVSLALTVGGVRGGGNSQIQTLVIPPNATQAQLLLNLKSNDFSSYRATLQTVAGVEIFSQTNVKPRRAATGPGFTFTVPASKLTSGDYVLTLRGVSSNGEVEDLSKSLFRVEKHTN